MVHAWLRSGRCMPALLPGAQLPSARAPRRLCRPQVTAAEGHKRGCRCKRSKCLKKYCECYHAGAKCNPDVCQCEGCRNT